MQKTFTLVIGLLLSLSVIAQTNLTPTSTTGKIINYNNFSVSYSSKHKNPEWVFYKLTENDFGNVKRSHGKFVKDKNFNHPQQSQKDYDADNSKGYDRGHLNPAADNSLFIKEMRECFYFTNMSPQVSSFNRYIWANLENQFRYWSIKNNKIYVVTGAVLGDGLSKIGDGVSVPKYFYKIAYCPSKKKMIAFLLENRKYEDNFSYSNHTCSVDKIETLTGIDFFSGLDDQLENRLESNTKFDNWEYTRKRYPQADHRKENVVAKATRQCLGKTKKGTRCKRKTSHSSGYCKQHRH